MSCVFKLAGVAIVKDEASYIEEWICHHLRLGFEHFFIFDNGSTDNTDEIIAPYIKYGIVTYIKWPLFPGQIDAYGFALRAFGHMAEWMSFFDIDEFFILKKHLTIPHLLANIDADQLLVFWKMFGHSGHIARPSGSVVESYCYCEDTLVGVTKCIVRPGAVQLVFVHNCATETARTVNDRGVTLREEWMHDSDSRSEELIRLNHYFTRSYEEYAAKIRRGQVDGRSQKKLEPFSTYDYKTFDDSAIASAALTDALVKSFRRLPVQPHRYGGMSRIGAFSNPRNFVLFSQNVVRESILAIAPGNAEIHHYWCGTLAYFPDVSVGERLAAWTEARVTDWSSTTNSTIAAADGYRDCTFSFHNGETTRKEHSVAFFAQNTDPQIVASFQAPGTLGYYWMSAVISVPYTTTMEVFAFGKDAHGSDMKQLRTANLAPGLYLALLMVNDEPLAATSVRLDPGAIAGAYELWNMTVFHCQ